MSHLLNTSIKKPKFLVTTHSSAQTTSTTAEVGTVITGSEITYTPTEDAQKVIYEIGFYAEKINQRSFTGWYLQEYTSGSWSEIESRYRRNFGWQNHDNQAHRLYTNYRYILPAWSGSKQLRLVAAFPTGEGNIDLNQLSQWDGASATTIFCNTSLLIHSI